MPIFMKAGTIAGDIVAASHKGWFQIEACNFGLEIEDDLVRARIGDSPRAAALKDAIPPDLSLFEVTKRTPGRSVPGLMEWIVSGDQLDEVIIDVCGGTTGDSGKWRSHMLYELKKVRMKDYKMSMADAEKGQLSINMKLSYETLAITQFSYDKKNPVLAQKSQPVVISKPPQK